MLKNNVKKIIICLISIVMVITVASKTLATDSKTDADKLNELLQNAKNNTITENQTPEKMNEVPEKTNNNTQNLNNNVQNTNNKNENKPTTTPYTGIGDYSSVIFIVIFAASAIYAFKKIRDYNI